MSHDSSAAVPSGDDTPAHIDPEEVRRRSARVRLWQNLGALLALILAVALLVAPLFVFESESSGEPRSTQAKSSASRAR